MQLSIVSMVLPSNTNHAPQKLGIASIYPVFKIAGDKRTVPRPSLELWQVTRMC